MPRSDDEYSDYEPEPYVGSIAQLTDRRCVVPKKHPIGFDLTPRPKQPTKEITRHVILPQD